MRRLLWMLAVCGATASVAAPVFAQTNAGTLRFSWNSCEGVTPDDTQSIADGTNPELVVSGIGIDVPAIGYNLAFILGPNIPDSWRFDDAGCQTASQLAFQFAAFSKTCPLFQGGNPLPITFFGYDVASQRAEIQIFNAFDTFTPSIGTRYTFVQISFDHSFSTPNPTTPGVDCGEVDQPLCIAVKTALIAGQDGLNYFPALENNHANWVSEIPGCPGIVPTQVSTWGRLKGQYR